MAARAEGTAQRVTVEPGVQADRALAEAHEGVLAPGAGLRAGRAACHSRGCATAEGRKCN